MDEVTGVAMQEPRDGSHGPRQSSGEVHETLVGSVRILLLALLAVPLLLLILSSWLLGPESLSRDGMGVLVFFAGIAALGLSRLWVGRLGQSVTLVITGVLAGLAWETIQAGVAGFSAFLFAYSVPIAFAALLVGRRALLATTAASITIVVTVHLLERAGVAWIGTDVDQPPAGMMVIAFALISALLALVLERFGVVLKVAHEAGRRREIDLEEMVGELESQIEERKQAEVEREAAERERERLLELERMARKSAESSSARLSFLAEASHLLNTTLDLDETLRRLSDLVVPRWASWCAIDFVDEGGTVRPLVVAHQDPQIAQWAVEMRDRFRMSEGPLSTATAISTAQTQFLKEVTESDLAAAAANPDHLEVLQRVGMRSVVIVPLVVRGSAIGSLMLVSDQAEHPYSEDDVVFFEELAARASGAVDNSRLFDQIRALNRDLEERVEQRTQEFRNTLSELEAFAYSVSHDLRTPLRGIDGFSQALIDDYGDRLDAVAVENLQRIRRAATRMGQLIDALLTLSSLPRGDLKLEEVDLSEMAEQLIADLRKGDPHREVEVVVEPGMRARADPELLEFAFGGLIGNAWKFTRVRERARIGIGTARVDGERAYFVSDNGIGFDMAYYNKLFSPFQRLHAQQFEGTGIGLAVAQRVITRHAGRIWAEGEVEEGATFYFTLNTWS